MIAGYRDRLESACGGSSLSQGGLNVTELKSHFKTNKGYRKDLQDRLCQQLIETNAYHILYQRTKKPEFLVKNNKSGELAYWTTVTSSMLFEYEKHISDETRSERRDEYYRHDAGAIPNLELTNRCRLAILKAKKPFIRPVLQPPDAVAPHYPNKWTKLPGDKGFNAYVTDFLKSMLASTPHQVTCNGKTSVLQPYQLTASFLLHPSGPPQRQRMLVVHRTGSGKTNTMIQILDNYFDDVRPKIVIVPTDALRDQLYDKLMETDNRYSKYIEDVSTGGPKKDRTQVREILEMKNKLPKRGQPGYLVAPLRIYSYNQAGSKSMETQKWMKHGTSTNIYSGKILLMDEAHNLINPNPEKVILESSRRNLEKLRERIQTCTESVVACMTATPCVKGVDDGDRLMEIVKGPDHANLTDEGFISAFMGHNATFPKAAEPEIVHVPLPPGGPLMKLLKKEKRGTAKRRIREYTTATRSKSFLTSLLTSPEIVAPQLAKVVELINGSPGKVVVLTDVDHGFFALEYLWRNKLQQEHGTMKALLGKVTKSQTFDPELQNITPKAALTKVKDVFDHPSNDTGTNIKVLLLNAAKFDEGVDFKCVRRVILLDIARSSTNLQQRIGRAIRMCSHSRLPDPADHTVDIKIIVSKLPDEEEGESEDQCVMDKINTQRTEIHRADCRLTSVAFDREALRQVGTQVETLPCVETPPAIIQAPTAAMKQARQQAHDHECDVQYALDMGHLKNLQDTDDTIEGPANDEDMQKLIGQVRDARAERDNEPHKRRAACKAEVL